MFLPTGPFSLLGRVRNVVSLTGFWVRKNRRDFASETMSDFGHLVMFRMLFLTLANRVFGLIFLLGRVLFLAVFPPIPC